ncbi:MAG: MoxR family ATPase [Gammaproteobacteria bacterium]|nr:MoxR family ATPase [Gammaproteobacteria bacterium]
MQTQTTAARQEWASNLAAARAQLDSVIAAGSGIILGKERELRLSLACLLARGHLLIEDLPGVGKTTLAQLLACSLGLSFRRIQFTSDLLPADILGVSVYLRDGHRFEFHPGPIFAQVVLADEVNRATPRTQSALLEAMEETQVTMEGVTHALPRPFFVVATQNPSYQVGTYPLPESQLDRFLMRIEIGYPDTAAERQLLKGRDRRELLAEMPAALSAEQVIALQAQVEQISVADALLDYLQALLEYSRRATELGSGLSPRAGLAMLRAARAWALMSGRRAVVPEDVQAVLPSVVGHRLQRSDREPGVGSAELAARLIGAVPIP